MSLRTSCPAAEIAQFMLRGKVARGANENGMMLPPYAQPPARSSRRVPRRSAIDMDTLASNSFALFSFTDLGIERVDCSGTVISGRSFHFQALELSDDTCITSNLYSHL